MSEEFERPWVMSPVVAKEITDLRIENAALRSEVEDWKTKFGILQRRAPADSGWAAFAGIQAEMMGLRAERETLREACQEWLKAWVLFISDNDAGIDRFHEVDAITRRALNPEEWADAGAAAPPSGGTE